MVAKWLPWLLSLIIAKDMRSFSFCLLVSAPKKSPVGPLDHLPTLWQEDRGPKSGAGAVLQRKGRLLLPEKGGGVLSSQKEQMSTHILHNCMPGTFTSCGK